MHDPRPSAGDRRLVLPPGTDAQLQPERQPPRAWSEVPWRTIIASVAVVTATILGILIVRAVLRIVGFVVIAGFFAIVLAPAVSRMQGHLRGSRIMATSIVVFSALVAVLGTMTLFVLPVRHQLVAIATDLPGTIEDAADGRGPFGRVVQQLNLADYVRDHETELQDAVSGLHGSGFDLAKTVVEILFTVVTITVMTFLFLTQSANLANGASNLLPRHRRESVRRAARDAAAAISGYMIGNLLISLIAGLAAYVMLVALGVPNAIVLALWVAFADLIPLVGATIGAVVASFAALLHSTAAGVVSIVFFILYQQIENYGLYPAVMSRRVKVNPLIVLVGVLLGVELFGFVGALLAVPVSGALQVAVLAARSEHQRDQLVLPELDPEATPGADA